MSEHPIRVAVNGYGVIGKRVVDAVFCHAGHGVGWRRRRGRDWRIRTAVGQGIAVFAATGQANAAMRAAGVPVAGSLEDLLAVVDVVVDTTLKKVAETNVPTYQAAGVKAVFQGGEAHATTGHSFVAQANSATAVGRGMTRVVS